MGRKTLWGKENLNLKPGDSVRGEFSFRVTAAKSGKFGHYYAGKGIFLTGYQKGELVTRSVTYQKPLVDGTGTDAPTDSEQNR